MNRQKTVKGSVGTDLSIYLEFGSMRKALEVRLNAPLADDDATLKIYNDSVDESNLIYDGYLINRDADGTVLISNPKSATSKIIVSVVGGTGDLIATAFYE